MKIVTAQLSPYTPSRPVSRPHTLPWDKIRKARGKDAVFYEVADKMFYPVYEQKRKFLLSAESALNSTRAERIAKQVTGKDKSTVLFAMQ